jgi:exodeoxyribonuclease VII large subunit
MSVVFPPAGIKVLSVGELTRGIKQVLEETQGTVWVEGEVSNLSRPSSGHLYLTLKDEEAPLETVVYRGVALRMKFDLRDGMHVIAKGRLTVYVPRGRYQLQVEEVQPKGIGPLELAFRQLKEKLSLLGYFEPRRKKPLPRIPRRIALISSGTGSAVRDMLEVLSRRWPASEVWVVPVRVQGEGAAQEISDAITLLNQISGPERDPSMRVEVILIGRGGGSLEDLWAFNEEPVADAIFRSRIPIMTGIGHEDDLTIADMVADQRALTPTEAAERAVPDRAKVLEWLGNLENQFRLLLRRRLETAAVRLAELANRRCFRNPLERVRECERQVDDWSERLQRAMQHRLQQARQRLEAQAGKLEGLSPLNVLARGYSLTRKEADGSVVRDAGQVKPGERLLTHVQQGEIVSRVESIVPAPFAADGSAPAMQSGGEGREPTKGGRKS